MKDSFVASASVRPEPTIREALERAEMWLSTHPEGKAMAEVCRAALSSPISEEEPYNFSEAHMFGPVEDGPPSPRFSERMGRLKSTAPIDVRDDFEDWAIGQSFNMEINEDEERTSHNNAFYAIDATNSAFIGWKAALAHANPASDFADWRSVLADMIKAMRKYEMDVDSPAPNHHRQLMGRAEALLAVSKPELRRLNFVRETFAYYISSAENGLCRVPCRVADDMLQSYKALENRLSSLADATPSNPPSPEAP